MQTLKTLLVCAGIEVVNSICHGSLLICRDAVNINVLGVQRMLGICKSLPNLEVN